MAENAQPQENLAHNRHPTRAATDWVEYTPDPGDLTIAPRAVAAEGAGTITMEGVSGEEWAAAFADGEIKAVSPVKITAASVTKVFLLT